MHITLLTLFPEAVEPYIRASILGNAQRAGVVEVRAVDFRDFARDRHRTVDDRPFGGGPGMVLKPEPIVECVEWLERRHGAFHKILLTPQGTPFRQATAERLAAEERVLLCCGRYEGFDERIRLELEWEEISLGDFVLAGGELPALAVMEAVVRLVPGALGDERSAAEESFGKRVLPEGGPQHEPPRAVLPDHPTESSPSSSDPTHPSPSAAGAERGWLDHPHYTRPRVFRGREVPPVLLSGDHGAIARWRAAEARKRTLARRPDLTHDD